MRQRIISRIQSLGEDSSILTPQCVNTSCGHVSSSFSNQSQSPPPRGDRDTPASGSPHSIYRQTAGLDFSLSSSFLSESYSNFKPFFSVALHFNKCLLQIILRLPKEILCLFYSQLIPRVFCHQQVRVR